MRVLNGHAWSLGFSFFGHENQTGNRASLEKKERQRLPKSRRRKEEKFVKRDCKENAQGNPLSSYLAENPFPVAVTTTTPPARFSSSLADLSSQRAPSQLHDRLLGSQPELGTSANINSLPGSTSSWKRLDLKAISAIPLFLYKTEEKEGSYENGLLEMECVRFV
ncbi:hypothetical protein ACE6H2_000646 [Prunus campanulata]